MTNRDLLTIKQLRKAMDIQRAPIEKQLSIGDKVFKKANTFLPNNDNICRKK